MGGTAGIELAWARPCVGSASAATTSASAVTRRGAELRSTSAHLRTTAPAGSVRFLKAGTHCVRLSERNGGRHTADRKVPPIIRLDLRVPRGAAARKFAE